MWPFFLCYYRNLVRETNLVNVVVLFVSFYLDSTLMDFSHTDSWLVHYMFKGSQKDFPNKYVLQSLNIAFIIENSADSVTLMECSIAKLPF